ncbi:MAG: aminotransferase class I/II-fold pyridoxal phosphate-dependent enzyme, partial [Gammaproteobacteria bacterium]|nr:aminotransferase class I/II-fold pyridoxal phosphate-dependent enzyme [Gammaproteobacteria bacterium]
LDAWNERCKLLFVCSPNNPTGNQMPEAQINALGASLNGRGLIVVDGAYLEFARDDPTARLLERHDNVVVLRTLSKALGLAGARCGVLLSSREIVDLLAPLLPPYCLSTPCQEAVFAALETGASRESRQRLELLVDERRRMADTLSGNARVRKVWPSDANFILVESADAKGLVDDATAAGILIRDFSWDRWTPDCVRITVGTPEQNDRLLEALG